MRCPDFRIAAEDRPAGAACLSPRLQEHLARCAACGRWEKDREIWGELGLLFREDPPVSETLILRSRVRTALGRAGAARSLWFRPAYGAVAAATLLAVASWGIFGPGRLIQPTAPVSPKIVAPSSPSGPAAVVRLVRKGDDVAIEWPSNGHEVHRIVRSNDPSDFSRGEVLLVTGKRWVDPSPAFAAGLQFYRID